MYRCLFSFSNGFFLFSSRLFLVLFKVKDGLRGEITHKHGVLKRLTWHVCEINIHKDIDLLFRKQSQLPRPIYIPGDTLCLSPT